MFFLRHMRGTVWVAAIALGALRMAYALSLPLHPDEAYYWEWSRNLSASYFDQGPGIAFYIRTFTLLFGDSQFALKLAASIAAIVCSILVFETAVAAGLTMQRAALAFALIVLAPGFFGGALFIVHDTAYLLAWSAASYFSVRFFSGGGRLSLIAMFVFVGLGALSKHTMLLFALAFAVWIFVARARWRLLARWDFWLGVLLCLLLVSPILYWNALNEWDGVGAILNLRSSGASGGRGAIDQFLLGQLAAFSPLWLLLLAFLALRPLWQLVGKTFRRSAGSAQLETADVQATPALRWIGFLSAGYFLFFAALSLTRSVQANWAFAAYPGFCILLAARLPRTGASGARSSKIVLVSGLLPALLLDTFALASLPLIRSLAGKAPVLLPALQLQAYPLAIAALEERAQAVDSGARIASNRYQDAAIASWYRRQRVFTPALSILQKTQYSFWTQPVAGENYIVFHIDEDPRYKSHAFFPPILKYMFREVRDLPPLEISIQPEGVVLRMQLWYCKGYRRHWSGLLVDYMQRRAILDLMPNLRDPRLDTEDISLVSTREMLQMTLQMYQQLRGRERCQDLAALGCSGEERNGLGALLQEYFQ